MPKSRQKPNALLAAFDGDTEATPEPTPKAKPKAARGKKKIETGETVLIGGHFSPQVRKQLRSIAAEEDTTNQALLAEALNMLFRKKGKELIKNL